MFLNRICFHYINYSENSFYLFLFVIQADFIATILYVLCVYLYGLNIRKYISRLSSNFAFVRFVSFFQKETLIKKKKDVIPTRVVLTSDNRAAAIVSCASE